MKITGTATAGLSRSAAFPAAIGASRRRYALVGLGNRSGLYRQALLTTFKAQGELVGYCDTNPGRLQLFQAEARALGAEIPIYAAANFDRMLLEQRPEFVIVTTPDSTHDQYIIRAMELGVDVISEKPLTTDEKKCRAIIAAQRRTGRQVFVTFNCRYAPYRGQIKRLLSGGVIGDILSVDFQWMLDTGHGADYFRRWHSQKSYSGGLLVHKATHHFDLVNWWLSAIPVSVMAAGKRDFYTPEMARRLGLQSHHDRCQTCPEKEKCAFFLDLAADPDLKRLYLDQEKFDGYFRDRCVFRPEIDIEDTMNVIVKYHTGATLSYSLNAFAAWEGYQITFNGTQGRLEHGMQSQVIPGGGRHQQNAARSSKNYIRIHPLRAAAYEVAPEIAAAGSHDGADALLVADLFAPQPAADELLRKADQRAGAYSILTGIAANHSMRSGQEVRIDELVSDIGMPEFPPMPARETPVPLLPREKPPA